jgi:hypothetical protein
MTHTWRWKCYHGERCGRPCRIVHRQERAERRMESMLVEFEDGFVACTSWLGLKEIQPEPSAPTTAQPGGFVAPGEQAGG